MYGQKRFIRNNLAKQVKGRVSELALSRVTGIGRKMQIRNSQTGFSRFVLLTENDQTLMKMGAEMEG